MSRNELIDAYRRGRISRRTFVKGMTAVGVSAVAAAGMADRYRSGYAAQSDVYPDDDDTYGGTGGNGTTQLPNTGIGGSDDSGSSILKPVAIAGAAAAAFVASRYRKIRGAETE